MADGSPFANNPSVSRIVGHYTQLYETWLDRWRQVVIAGRSGSYTADLWARDAATTVSEITGCVSLAAEFIDPPAGSYIPELSLEIAVGDAQVLGVLPIPAPGDGVVIGRTPLTTADGSVTIPDTNVQFWLVDENVLVVRLRKLDQHPPLNDLASGQRFTASFYAGNDSGDVRARLVVAVA